MGQQNLDHTIEIQKIEKFHVATLTHDNKGIRWYSVAFFIKRI